MPDEPFDIRALARPTALTERLDDIDARLQALVVRLDRMRRRLEVADD